MAKISEKKYSLLYIAPDILTLISSTWGHTYIVLGITLVLDNGEDTVVDEEGQ